MLIDYNADDLLHSLGGNRGDKIFIWAYTHIYMYINTSTLIYSYKNAHSYSRFLKTRLFPQVALLTLTDKHHSEERV